jgi:hypothetical protein
VRAALAQAAFQRRADRCRARGGHQRGSLSRVRTMTEKDGYDVT